MYKVLIDVVKLTACHSYVILESTILITLTKHDLTIIKNV